MIAVRITFYGTDFISLHTFHPKLKMKKRKTGDNYSDMFLQNIGDYV
jgi:hypothetical protein